MPYPDNKLWELLKPLSSSTIKIYKEHQDEDNDKKPDKYIVIQEEVYDEPEAFGDGSSILRSSSFEIYINCRKANDTRSIYRNVVSILKNNEIPYTLSGNIYDSQSGYFTRTITGDLIYHE